MIKVISNTTPILTLLKISRLDILKKLFKKIIIPFGVYEEIEAGKNKEFYVDLKSINWIEIENIKEDRELLFELDKGEAETIILAKEIKADLVLLDEKLGRKYAKMYDLRVAGTLGVLIEAKKKGIVENLNITIENMKSKGIWLSEKIIQEVLRKGANDI